MLSVQLREQNVKVAVKYSGANLDLLNSKVLTQHNIYISFYILTLAIAVSPIITVNALGPA